MNGRAFSQLPWDYRMRQLDRQYETDFITWGDVAQRITDPDTTAYGYALSGGAILKIDNVGFFTLYAGMYFSCTGPFSVIGTSEARGFMALRRGFRGVFNLGGPVEERGRLRYIDGCTDSLLLAPQRRGDPCLNLLYFPPRIDQTAHTHPSDRIGIVAKGRGVCVADGKETPLTPGMLFCIHTDGTHKFQTNEFPMTVIAYHPDSDFGPTDEDHPMINRTMVEGVSAREITGIRSGSDTVVA
jgi:quercetin dioxygenase-like cupin family protein